MRVAQNLIRSLPHYRRSAFEQGLTQCGYRSDFSRQKKTADLLVIWNRYGYGHGIARTYENANKPVIVAENGYLDDVKRFALAA